MSHATIQVIAAVLSIALLTTLVLKAKLHPFLAVLCASIFLALAIQMPATTAMTSFTAGVGATLGQVAIVLALGAVLGEMLSVSGGAETIATTLLTHAGERGLPWAMLLLGILIGMPVFFEVGLVLLIPIALTIAHRSGKAPVAIALPMLAGLSVTHGLIPPHPAALLAMTLYHADIAKGILVGLIIGIPSAALAGPVYLWVIRRSAVLQNPAQGDASDNEPTPFEAPADVSADAPHPGLLMAASITLLPVFLILLGSLSDHLPLRFGAVRIVLHDAGIPSVALLIAVLWSFYVVHRTRGFGMASIEKFAQESLGPMAAFLIILGAAGGFCRILQDSGIAATIVASAMHAHLPLILLAWLIAAGVRLATGSATIAMTTSATIVASATIGMAIPHPELLAIASGSGSLIFSHVNDGGFWMIKGFLKLSLKETFATWSVMETILAVSGLIFALSLSAFLPA
ncbi:GntP family permease [Granulicella paludicola]|uniref:GntP family permease n=1 Tax=Granulicella paludicola TaxID=474951 RepID=UPI0021E06CCC|nr:GntP family permease [Granulicella paludicola]